MSRYLYLLQGQQLEDLALKSPVINNAQGFTRLYVKSCLKSTKKSIVFITWLTWCSIDSRFRPNGFRIKVCTSNIHLWCFAIWYHLYNLQNVKKTYGGMLLLVKLQDSVCKFTKSKMTPWMFFSFFKLYKWY